MKNLDALRELRNGIEEESEHGSDYDAIKKKMPTKQGFFAMIAKTHLKQDPHYYSKES